MVVDKEISRILTLLRNKIRERGFTQLEVQDALGWGRSYISQLLTRQKSLRVEQVLLILKVIDVEPADFYGELYHFAIVDGKGAAVPEADSDEANPAGAPGDRVEAEIRRVQDLQNMVRGMASLLVEKDVFNADELASAVEESQGHEALD